jgi:hypothetical protein
VLQIALTRDARHRRIGDFVTRAEFHPEALSPRHQTLSWRNRRSNPMKKLVSVIVAAGLAAAFVTPTLAAEKTPTTKAACEKAKMHWDAATKTCAKSNM